MEEETSKPNKEYLRLAIALAVIILILGGFIFYLSWPLMTGTEIILATEPVDPFEPFRGQYMQINYNISTIPVIEGIKQNDKVYVILKANDENVWVYQRAERVKPKDGTFILGTVSYVSGNQMRIEYGIEQYFFERNAYLSTQNITVEARVSSSGKARITRLLQNGEPVKIEYNNPKLTS